MSNAVVIYAAVEGLFDEAVTRRLVVWAGGLPGPVYGKNGKDSLRRQIQGYNNAARHAAWLVLVDLNSDAVCAPPLREQWLANPAPLFCFRVAVWQVEPWLVAARECLAPYLRVAQSRILQDPESLPNAEVAMVSLARRCRRRAIREDMVQREESGRRSGRPIRHGSWSMRKRNGARSWGHGARTACAEQLRA